MTGPALLAAVALGLLAVCLAGAVARRRRRRPAQVRRTHDDGGAGQSTYLEDVW